MSPVSKSRSSRRRSDPAVARAHKGYVDAINSNKTARVMAMLDKDAMIFAPNGPAVSGKKKLRAWVSGYFKAYRTHWTKQSFEMVNAGEWAFDCSNDTSVDTPRTGGGKPIKDRSKGILVYKRQSNGEFKVYRDIWNSKLKAPGT